MTEDFLKNFGGKTFLDCAGGVSVPRGVGGLFCYLELFQQRVVVPAAEVGGHFLTFVAGQEQIAIGLLGEVCPAVPWPPPRRRARRMPQRTACPAVFPDEKQSVQIEKTEPIPRKEF